jgi:hypothetical protein
MLFCITGQGFARRRRWLRDPTALPPIEGSAAVSEQSRNLSIQTALIAEEIGRTREICARTLEILHEPFPNTFLGNKLDPLRETEKK